jgi:hypothetical protein
MKTPKTKLQIPKKLQAPNSNTGMGVIFLELEGWISLEFGVWVLVFRPPLTADH